MKKTALIFVTLFTACILQACHGNKTSEDGDDTASAIVDTSKNVSIIVGKDDARFITDIGGACLAEIKIGAIAKQKGSDKRVKNFGAMMMKDLTKGHARLLLLANSKKIKLPDSITADDQKAIAELAQKSGDAFDHAYLDKIRGDYKQALGLFQNTAKTAYDPQIKAFAAHNILTIQRHLDLIDAIQGSLK